MGLRSPLSQGMMSSNDTERASANPLNLQRTFDQMADRRSPLAAPQRRVPSSLSREISQDNSPPPNNNLSQNSERQRFSHPHNPPQLYRRPSENMASQSQAERRPTLLHQASRTRVIDLTEEDDEDIVRGSGRGSMRGHRPPQLDRSDAQNLGRVEIDLTDEPDIEFISSRQLPALANAPRPTIGGRASFDFGVLPSGNAPPAPDPRRLLGIGEFLPAAIQGMLGPAAHLLGIGAQDHLIQHLHHAHHVHGHVHQNLPGAMDYGRAAFAPERKPDHVPPPPAREGFTRSPKEDEILICPSCEEELVHHKYAVEEPVAAAGKGNKAPTKKDREEHPFWVVKECGHVFCNHCYQNRIPNTKRPKNVSFEFSGNATASARATKKVICCVDECESDVRTKDKWVGVFM